MENSWQFDTWAFCVMRQTTKCNRIRNDKRDWSFETIERSLSISYDTKVGFKIIVFNSTAPRVVYFIWCKKRSERNEASESNPWRGEIENTNGEIRRWKGQWWGGVGTKLVIPLLSIINDTNKWIYIILIEEASYRSSYRIL